jgi:hypothetical protein
MGSGHTLALGDYDGDRRTDRAIVAMDTGRWYVIPSSRPDLRGLPEIPWGSQWPSLPSGALLALGDYDGDGRTDRAVVVRTGGWDAQTWRWLVQPSSLTRDAPTEIVVPIVGVALGRLAIGDYDGDGRDDPGVQNVANGEVTYVTAK